MRATRIAVAALVVAMIAAPSAAQQDQQWSFSGVERFVLDGLSGDITVRPATGSEARIKLEWDVKPTDAFQSKVRQDGTTVRLEEHWSGRSSSGHVGWVLEIPASAPVTINIDTVSGDLEAAGVQARFQFDSASGDITLRDMTVLADSSFDTASGDLKLTDMVVGDDVSMDTASGDVDLSGVTAGRDFSFDTASGDVHIERSRGVLKGSTASGDVHVSDTTLEGPSHFSSASGEVFVQLSSMPAYDLEASSASGDVDLQVRNFGDDFTLVMTARQDRGDIDSPFEFTSKRTYERHGQVYDEKTVKRGSGSPVIRLSTASGSVKVRN